jgi:GT2 family glycosyltransferase
MIKNIPKFSIIIPSLNGKKLLAECLPSIENQTDKDFEVIIVDNGSKDNSISFIRKQFPAVRILDLKKPAGFAKPVNAGIKAARGKYIFLLNNDVVLDKNCLAEIGQRLDQRKDIGFCACLMLTADGKNIDSAGDDFSWWGRAYPTGRGENPQKFQKERFVFGACGGASVFRKEIFDKIGVLDEDFYAYFEDVDLSFRAQLAGFKCFYVPKAIIYHRGSTTFKRDSFKMRYIGNRNKDWVILKNYPRKFLLINLHKLLAVKLKSLATDFWDGLFFAGIGAIFSDIWNFPKLLAKRKKIQSLRTVSDQYLQSIINSSHPRLR